MTDITTWTEQKCASNRLQRALYCPSFQPKTSRQWGDYSFLYGVERLGASSFANLAAWDWKGKEGCPQPPSHSAVSSHKARLAIWGPKIPMPFEPLRRTWFASDLQQTPTWNKLSSPGYRHSTSISSTPGYTLFNKNQADWNFLSPAQAVTWRTVAIIIRVVLLIPYLCIRGVSLSSIHYTQSRRVYINQRHQHIRLIWS
jgi:hypothetical protein